MRVGRNAENSGVDGLEARQGIVVLDDLGGADEGEVERVEEEDNPLALIVLQGDVLELAAREDGGGSEGRSRTLDESSRHDYDGFWFEVVLSCRVYGWMYYESKSWEMFLVMDGRQVKRNPSNLGLE